MLNKKGQGMHMWGGTDAIIILVGIAIGIGLLWYLRDISFVQDLICAASAPVV